VRLAALLLLGTAGAGGFAVMHGACSPATEAPAAAPKAPAAIATRSKGTVQLVAASAFVVPVRVTGSVKSDGVVELSTKATGLVRQVLAREGDRVRAGQLLVQIDDAELRAQRDKARAALRSAEARLKQAGTSRDIKNAAVGADYRSAQQALETARTRLSQAKALAQISATEVESGVEGAQARLQAARERLKLIQDGARHQEKATAELAVTWAQAQANKLKGNLERREQLLRQGAIAREDVEHARRDYEAALAEVESAKQQLDLVSEGSRSEEIRVAEEEVRQAEAALRTSEANRARRQISDEDVDAAEGQVRQAEAALDSARAALGQRAWNEDEIHTARAAVAQARAELRYYDQLIAETRVYSPVNAVVTQRKVHVGETVSQTRNTLFTLVATDTLYFEATAPESVLPYLGEGGSAAVTLDALPGRTFPGVLREIIPVAEGADRSVRLRISLPWKDRGFRVEGQGLRGTESTAGPQASSLKPQAFRDLPISAVVGGFARATVRGASRRPVITVPVAALVSDDGERTVFLYREGKAHSRTVQTGAMNGSRVEILAGLRPGDRVIVSGAETLTDGQAVEIAPERRK
jgi:HlyD family secretion protein